MVAHRPKTPRPSLPPDGPLMALCRVDDARRLLLGGGSEDSDQRRLAQQLDARALLWNHCPNEAERDEAERGAALARGLKKGVPDAMIYVPFAWGGVRYSGLAIELKRSDETACSVSDSQRQWLTRLRANGWMAEWARGFAEAEALVRRAYGGG